MDIFATRLKELRQSSKYTQKDIAKAISIELRSYQRYEEGVREPDNITMIQLADHFNVSIDYLLGRTDNPKVNK